MEEQGSSASIFNEQLGIFNQKHMDWVDSLIYETVTEESFPVYIEHLKDLHLKAQSVTVLGRSIISDALKGKGENKDVSNNNNDIDEQDFYISNKINEVRNKLYGIEFFFQEKIRNNEDPNVQFKFFQYQFEQNIKDYLQIYRQIQAAVTEKEIDFAKIVGLCEMAIRDYKDLNDIYSQILEFKGNQPEIHLKGIQKQVDQIEVYHLQVDVYLEGSQNLQLDISELTTIYSNWKNCFEQLNSAMSKLDEEYKTNKAVLFYNNTASLYFKKFSASHQEFVKYTLLLENQIKSIVIYKKLFPGLKKNLAIDWNLLESYKSKAPKILQRFENKIKNIELEKEKELCASDKKKTKRMPPKPSQNRRREKRKEEEKKDTLKLVDSTDIQILQDSLPMTVVVQGRKDEIEGSSGRVLQSLVDTRKKAASEPKTMSIVKIEENAERDLGNAGMPPSVMETTKMEAFPDAYDIYKVKAIIWRPIFLLERVKTAQQESQIPQQIKDQAVWVMPTNSS